MNDRIKAQHTRQAVIYGITNIDSLPDSVPNLTHKGKPIAHFGKHDFKNFFPPLRISVFFDKDVSFGAMPMGNNLIAWRLLAPQETTGQLADTYIMPVRRAALVHDAAHMFSHVVPKSEVKRGSAEDIMTPSALKFDDVENPSPLIDVPQRVDAFPKVSNPSHSEHDTIGLLLTGSESLNGTDSRNLALFLSEETFPPHVVSLIASTDVNFTHTEDNCDLFDEYQITSFTSAKFHPGRVVILGDAAHALATSAIGSHGLTFSINDAVEFTTYLSKEFRNSEMIQVNMGQNRETNDAILLEQASGKFTESRLKNCLEAVNEARYISSWRKTEPWFYHKLIGESVWLSKSFDEMQKQG